MGAFVLIGTHANTLHAMKLSLLCLLYVLVNVTVYTNARKRIVSRRLGWTVKVHGNWCGPGWTGGLEVPSKEYFRMGLGSVPCLDEVDCACKLHDKSCAHENGCSKKADEDFIRRMREFLEDSPAHENWSLVHKAKVMKKAIESG